MVVAPECVLLRLPRIQWPAPVLVTASAVASVVLSISCRLIWLSPVELPWSVSSLAPTLMNATGPVLLNTSAALFAVPVPTCWMPKVPEESMMPLPASVKRRSMGTDGVCVAE